MRVFIDAKFKENPQVAINKAFASYREHFWGSSIEFYEDSEPGQDPFYPRELPDKIIIGPESLYLINDCLIFGVAIEVHSACEKNYLFLVSN